MAATAVILTAMFGAAWRNRAPEAVQVQTARAAQQDIYNSVTVQGTIEAVSGAAVCPQASAAVTAVYASVGDTVQEGDILCSLAPQGGGTVQVQSILQAAANGSMQTVTAAQADAIRAPVSGEVLALPSVGEQVCAGVPCAQVADLRKMCVRVRAPEAYAESICAGQIANVTAAADSGRIYGAQVRSIAPVAVRTFSLTGDSGEAMVEAVLMLRGDAAALRPGYSATAKIFTEHRTDAVTVPYEAVCQRGEQEYVFTVEDGRAVQHAVTTGYLLENAAEIREGLTGGETVILSPGDELADGAPVEAAA